MSLYTETRRITEELGLRPTRARGQNFLIDNGVLRAMIAAAELSPRDHVLEVGGGPGMLTRALSETGAQVTTVEIDPLLAGHLTEMTAHYPRLRIYKDDILAVNVRELMGERYKIVASLPYNITSIFFRNILEHQAHPERLVVLVQKEVAERITARPGDMSILAVSIQYFADTRIVRTVSSESFWPRPRVDSAILQIIPHPREANDPALTKKFFRLVRSGFASPRKQLPNNIHAAFQIPKQELEPIFHKLNIAPTARAQELTIEQWKSLTEDFDARGVL